MIQTEMSLVEEKKTEVPAWDGTKSAEAEALANAALLAAEEAKRAAERLKELRACLKYLDEKDPSKKIEDMQTEEDRDGAEETPTEAPVEETEEAPKSEEPAAKTKEVQIVEDTLVEAQAPPAPPAETDLIVQMLDAVGLDKLCGLDFEDPTIVHPDARKAVMAGNDPFGERLPVRAAAARQMIKEQAVEEVTEPAPVAEEKKTEETPAVVESEAPVEETAEEAKPEEESEKPAEETPSPKSSPKSKVSPIKQEILRRKKQDPILQKVDPFGGEEEGMDFIPCGV